MKKLVYISSIAAPHQVKLCYALQKYFDTEFWFYDEIGSRASWWKIDLGDKCKIIPTPFKWRSKFATLSHLAMIKKFNPDIVMIGGFSIPANYIAYLWAKMNNKKTVVFTERSRDSQGNLRKWGVVWFLIHWLYRNVDMVMVSAFDIVEQFRDEFKFGDKVVESRYATDLEPYLGHALRYRKDAYTFMFPNRLTDIYNPLMAVRIFFQVWKNNHLYKLVMNAKGELRAEVEDLVDKLRITEYVSFLDDLQSWDELHKEYEKCDIMIFPAKFSNGNFTIIEAMASGMGVVLSDRVLGIGKLIVNGENGFNIPLENVNFVRAINQFIENPALFTTFGGRNKDSVKHLGAKGTAKHYANLIQILFEK